MAAAIKEDPTVYQYDEVYDDMTDRKAEVKAAQSVEKADRKPKYIQNLLKEQVFISSPPKNTFFQ